MMTAIISNAVTVTGVIKEVICDHPSIIVCTLAVCGVLAILEYTENIRPEKRK